MKTTNIAVTGHKDLRAEDLPKIKEKVHAKLLEIVGSGHPTTFRLLVGSAEGADQVVAGVAVSLGIAVETIEEEDYEALAKHLVANANHLLALWDGIFNDKKGGTSDVVRLSMMANKTLIIHHLVTPRQQNPYPVASLLQEGLSFNDEQFQRIPFTVHFSWIEIPITAHKKGNILLSFFNIIWLKLGTDVFLSFILPMLLVSATLGLGTWGFIKKDCTTDYQNAFFKAVNLITFNNSVIEGCVPDVLNIARYLGLFTGLTAFVIALYFALGGERKRLKIIFWQRFRPKKYVIVLGLGEKSFDLVQDLVRKGVKVAVLAPNEDSPYRNDLEKLGAVFIKGSISSVKLFQSMYYAKASQVYVMSDSDTNNARATQELDHLTGRSSTTQKWYVHIQDTRQREFLYSHLSSDARNRLFIFDIYENTARRLQLYHPMDRFYQTPQAKETHVVILGFGNLGKQIALNCLRQGQFGEDKYLRISILSKDYENERRAFEKEYPFVKTDDDDKPYLKAIINDVFQPANITFHALPQSDAELLSSDSVLFCDIIKNEHIVSIYVCFENGLLSASYLSSLLPKLNYHRNKHNCNLQAFCFYNFPDKKEENAIEANFNNLAPNIPVFCFGNFLDECSVEFINNLALDALPKQIAYWYEQEYGNKKLSIEDVWRNCSEQDKEANRQAADHLWVKVRNVWHAIDWHFDPETFEPLVSQQVRENYESILSKIEHKRWCADLLLKGVRPLQDEVAPEERELEELKEFWFEKGGKKIFKPQKLHFDLRPFDELLPVEKQKDLSQIQKIPEFLRAIVKGKKP